MVIDGNRWRGAASSALRVTSTLLRRGSEFSEQWLRSHRTRHELIGLTEADLKDIGFPAEIEAASSKSFWRPWHHAKAGRNSNQHLKPARHLNV
jgi:uncharacterized protein YjiS (DUF1127 family)